MFIIYQSITLYHPDSNVATGCALPPVPARNCSVSLFAFAPPPNYLGSFTGYFSIGLNLPMVSIVFFLCVVARCILNVVFHCALDMSPSCCIWGTLSRKIVGPTYRFSKCYSPREPLVK